MRSGTGWAYGDGVMHGDVHATCDICRQAIIKKTSHDAVLYTPMVSYQLSAAMQDIPYGHTIVFCSKECHRDWIRGKKVWWQLEMR